MEKISKIPKNQHWPEEITARYETRKRKKQKNTEKQPKTENKINNKQILIPKKSARLLQWVFFSSFWMVHFFVQPLIRKFNRDINFRKYGYFVFKVRM